MDQVDSYLRSEIDKQQLPCLSAAVIHKAEVVLARGYGFANLERAVPATEQTVYMLASLTKSVAAVGVMMLVEEGRLSLDDSIARHLPHPPEAWQAITIRHLLTHTSGLENWEDVPSQVAVKEPLRAETPEEIVRFMTQFPLRFPPGEQWDYSNGGYLLLGHIVERISGRTLDVFLDERIFRPLEMNWTAYGVRELNCLSASYTWTEGRLQRIHRSEAWGHTGLVSTVLDLAKWDTALHAGRLLGRESLQLMWTPARLRNGTEVSYGLGWDIGETQGHRTVGHGGSRPGVSTRLMHDLRNELSVILLIPVGGVDTTALASGVLHAAASG